MFGITSRRLQGEDDEDCRQGQCHRCAITAKFGRNNLWFQLGLPNWCQLNQIRILVTLLRPLDRTCWHVWWEGRNALIAYIEYQRLALAHVREEVTVKEPQAWIVGFETNNYEAVVGDGYRCPLDRVDIVQWNGVWMRFSSEWAGHHFRAFRDNVDTREVFIVTTRNLQTQ